MTCWWTSVNDVAQNHKTGTAWRFLDERINSLGAKNRPFLPVLARPLETLIPLPRRVECPQKVALNFLK